MSGRSPRSAGAATNLLAAAPALVGAEQAEQGVRVPDDRPAAIRVRAPLEPGVWRLELEVTEATWQFALHLKGVADPVVLPLKPAGVAITVAFHSTVAIEAVSLWPVEGGVVCLHRLEAFALAGGNHGGGVAIGAVTVFLEDADETVPGRAPARGTGWADDVDVAGATRIAADEMDPEIWCAQTNGRVALALSSPRTGWQRVVLGVSRASGGPAIVRPYAAAGGVRRAMIDTGRTYQTLLRLGPGDTIELAPRRYPGRLRVKRVAVQPVPGWQVPFAAAGLLWHARRGVLPGPPFALREWIARVASWVMPPLGAMLSRESRWYRGAMRRGEADEVAAWNSRPALWDGPIAVSVAPGWGRARTRKSLESVPGVRVAGEAEDAPVLALRPGDRLAPHAVDALRRVPRGAVTADEDRRTAGIRHSPRRTAGWDEAAARFGAPVPCLVGPAPAADGPRPPHVPLVLVHRRRAARAAPPTIMRTGRAPVTIIAATRDAPKLLRRFLKTLALTRGLYSLILLDHLTRDAEALELLEEAKRAGHQVMHEARPFNFAAFNNRVARSVSGGVLVFANNDIAFDDPDWMTPLVAAAEEPWVGCAGALLRYPSGGIQHAGLVMAGEVGPRHLHRFAREDRRAASIHTVDAVSAALMAIRADLFHSLGGFDAAFPVRYNDIDLNLRAEAAGAVNVLVAQSRAVHHESASFGMLRTRRPDPVKDAAREAERRLFHARWGARLQRSVCMSAASDPRSARNWPRSVPPVDVSVTHS